MYLMNTDPILMHPYIAGVNARRPEGSKEADFDAPPTQFHAIMQRLFPVLLSLACAAEPVSHQLFEPLVMSLVHWLTRSARRSGPNHMTRAVPLLLPGLCQQRCFSGRVLCAACSLHCRLCLHVRESECIHSQPAWVSIARDSLQ